MIPCVHSLSRPPADEIPFFCPARPPCGGRFRLRPAGAFTLVELLTVLGVITLFLGLLSRATMTGVGQGLVAAQNSCAGLTQVARVQASLSQVNVRLLIFADTTTPDNKLDALRMLKVVMPDPNNSNNWVSTGAKTVYLPRNIFIVAPAQPIVPVINGLPAWPVKRNSRFSQNNGLAVALQVDGVKAN